MQNGINAPFQSDELKTGVRFDDEAIRFANLGLFRCRPVFAGGTSTGLQSGPGCADAPVAQRDFSYERIHRTMLLNEQLSRQSG
jgi:hypothetical protein